MVDEKEILCYIGTQQEVSIPELQKKFSASYLYISKIINKLVAEGLICFKSGVQFSVLQDGKGDDNVLASDSADDADVDSLSDLISDLLKDDEDSEDDALSEVYAISQAIKDGVSVIVSDGDRYLVPEGLEICGTEIRFKILFRDDGVYLSDEGFALLSLGNHSSYAKEGIDEQIDFIVDRYDINIVGDELQIKVDFPEDAIPSMMQLFAAMERIATIDEDAVAICAEHGKEIDRIYEDVKKLFTAEPDLKRDELVLRMRGRYRDVKDGENIDDIILYATAVKEFSRMSDDDYSLCRRILGGRMKQTK